jgi:hypothetical protein
MDSFQIFGRWDAGSKIWLVDVDPERDHSAFATGQTLAEALDKAVDMLLDTRKFRREHCDERLPGKDWPNA